MEFESIQTKTKVCIYTYIFISRRKPSHPDEPYPIHPLPSPRPFLKTKENNGCSNTGCYEYIYDLGTKTSLSIYEYIDTMAVLRKRRQA
jgi:hypothetical protein